jgi:hypothetical protein
LPDLLNTSVAPTVEAETTEQNMTTVVTSASGAIPMEEVSSQAMSQKELQKEQLMGKVKDLYFNMMQEQIFQSVYTNTLQDLESLSKKRLVEKSSGQTTGNNSSSPITTKKNSLSVYNHGTLIPKGQIKANITMLELQGTSSQSTKLLITATEYMQMNFTEREAFHIEDGEINWMA